MSATHSITHYETFSFHCKNNHATFLIKTTTLIHEINKELCLFLNVCHCPKVISQLNKYNLKPSSISPSQLTELAMA